MEVIKYCEECGKRYVARSLISKYCSNACNKRAFRKREKENKLLQGAQDDANNSNPQESLILKKKEFLTAEDIANLFGVSRTSVYRYFASGIIKAVRIGKTAFVRRADLDTLFETNVYKKRSYKITGNIKEYYTIKEIIEKYHIGKKAVLSRCDKFNIPKRYVGRNVFFNRASIDQHFAELIEDINLSNYYTIEQLIEKLGMNHSNVLTFVSRNKIPRTSRGRTVYYSRVHIDNYKRKGDDLDPNWYTYNELIERFGMTKDQISYFLKNCDIRTEKRGKYTMIYRSDFDKEVLNGRLANVERDEDGKLKSSRMQNVNKIAIKDASGAPETPEGYYSTEDVSIKYAMNIRLVQKITREQKIPRISLKGYNFYEKDAIESYFSIKPEYQHIKDWITPAEMREQYQMSHDAVRSFIHRHKVPTKSEYGKTYYSRKHIDDIKGLNFDGKDKYYSMKEIKEKYNLSKDSAFYYVKYYHLETIRKGQFVFVLKSAFDEVMKQKSEKTNK